MVKKISIVFLVSIYFLLSSCGFKPIYKFNDGDLNFRNYTLTIVNPVSREIQEEVNKAVYSKENFSYEVLLNIQEDQTPLIINTNGTNLNTKKANELIDSGLDQLIYSFDGGTKETYEKMRPGRFKKNNFEDVFNNIKNFYEIRKKRNSKFPITKIQMIMTKDTRDEVENFYSLFGEIVDDVTITQYNERGGNISDLDQQTKDKIMSYFKKNNLSEKTPYMVDIDNNIFGCSKQLLINTLYLYFIKSSYNLITSIFKVNSFIHLLILILPPSSFFVSSSTATPTS